MNLKLFVEEEIENVSRLLDETLRYDYGYERMSEFFSECRLRVDSLASAISRVDTTRLRVIERIAHEVSDLSTLITLIERSRLGEFSWPFADALRFLAGKTCAERLTPKSERKEPLFFISADGGIDAYRIHPEEEALQYCRTDRKIFNIVFPRTLKYHVLLHTILGHEIGHAAWTITEIRSRLRKDALTPLVTGSVLETQDLASRWLNSLVPNDHGIHFDDDESNENETLENWQQEFLCDLFGLILFGPSFLPAHRILLDTLDAEGVHPGWEHPPNISRFHMLSEAVDLLRWRGKLTSANPIYSQAIDSFWTNVAFKADAKYQHFHIFSRDQVQSAITGIENILNDFGCGLYQIPTEEELNRALEDLSHSVPPVGSRLVKKEEKDYLLRNSQLDFRSILLFGWISWYGLESVWKDQQAPTFLDLNRLCDQAILQQRAIDMMLSVD